MLSLTNMFSILGREPPKPTFLSLEVRKAMHAMGWTEVHYTHMSIGRECAYKLFLYLLTLQQREGAETSKRSMSVHALLGSVLHLAFENPEYTRQMGHDDWYWRQHFLNVLARDEDTTNYWFNDELIDAESERIREWSHKLATSSTWGISPANIIGRLMGTLTESGWEVIAQEYRYEYIDGEGSKYPIKFVGTIDLVMAIAGMLVIADLKTYGFWDPLLKGKGGVKAQNPDHDSLQLDPQLRHYAGFYELLTGQRVGGVALIFPSNVVPYKKSGRGYKAGDERGQRMCMVPNKGPKFSRSYLETTMKQIEAWVNGGFHRTYPRTFGKLNCPNCSHYDACLGNTEALVTDGAREVFAGYSR